MTCTRSFLRREHRHCGKEMKRKLEQGPVDHEVEFKCKVYGNGRVAADAETVRQLARYSERQIRAGSGLGRDTVRVIRHAARGIRGHKYADTGGQGSGGLNKIAHNKCN